ncbi:hypothetical protein R1flu_027081 [Riccia fluitans]|uniref:Uncharacterized protein n=1 Tax=Riccia fluitans TaxID=41844 RepID=A0ABD1XIH2_9MARC
MAEHNRDLFGVSANGEQHYDVSVMGTPLPDSDIDCSIGLSQVPSSQQVPRFSGFQWAPMRPMLAYVFPAGPVSVAVSSSPMYSGNLTPMSGSSALVTSVPQSFLSSLPGNSFPSPPAPQIFPVPGNSNAPPSAPQNFVVPSPVSIPAAATSPSADSARAESLDVEGGGEATLDGNGGAGSQGARRTLGLAAHGCNAETSQIRWKWDSLLMKYKSMKAYMMCTGVAPFATLTKAERKVENLPLDFNTSWFNMIESWYSTNPRIDPPCLADSSNPFSVEVGNTVLKSNLFRFMFVDPSLDLLLLVTGRQWDVSWGKRAGVLDDIQLLLVILAEYFLLVQELLATLLSSRARPVGSTLLSTSDMELEPEATKHFIAAIGVTFTLLSSCLRDSQEWWVR